MQLVGFIDNQISSNMCDCMKDTVNRAIGY